MKNYIKLLTDDEIKSYILSYLKLTNWRDDKNDINKIEDIVVKRNNNEEYLQVSTTYLNYSAWSHCSGSAFYCKTQTY